MPSHWGQIPWNSTQWLVTLKPLVLAASCSSRVRGFRGRSATAPTRAADVVVQRRRGIESPLGAAGADALYLPRLGQDLQVSIHRPQTDARQPAADALIELVRGGMRGDR